MGIVTIEEKRKRPDWVVEISLIKVNIYIESIERSHIRDSCVSTQIKTKLLLPLGSGQSLGSEASLRPSLKQWHNHLKYLNMGLVDIHTKNIFS
jgi:hypothetical protein